MHVLATNLTATHAYPWAALGVGLSVAIPFLTRLVAQLVPSTPPNGNLVAGGGSETFWPAAWKFVRPYLVVALFSLATAILIVAFVDFLDAKAAIIGGYAWDATLQKIRKGGGG